MGYSGVYYIFYITDCGSHIFRVRTNCLVAMKYVIISGVVQAHYSMIKQSERR